MADALASRSAVHAIVPESERPTEPDMPAVRPREESTKLQLGRVMISGRTTPLQTMLAIVLLGGPVGAGGAWLIGPGSITDDASVRTELEEIRREVKAEHDAASAERTAAAADRATAAAERAAQAKIIDELSKAVDSCEKSIDAADVNRDELERWIGSAMIVHNEALGDIADKIDARVDLRLPPMGGRRR